MTEQVTNITTLPKTPSTPKKIAKWAAVGVFAAGVLLLIDDQVKKVVRKDRDDETPES